MTICVYIGGVEKGETQLAVISGFELARGRFTYTDVYQVIQ